MARIQSSLKRSIRIVLITIMRNWLFRSRLKRALKEKEKIIKFRNLKKISFPQREISRQHSIHRSTNLLWLMDFNRTELQSHSPLLRSFQLKASDPLQAYFLSEKIRQDKSLDTELTSLHQPLLMKLHRKVYFKHSNFHNFKEVFIGKLRSLIYLSLKFELQIGFCLRKMNSKQQLNGLRITGTWRIMLPLTQLGRSTQTFCMNKPSKKSNILTPSTTNLGRWKN
jgi:hypothetical protein